MTLVQVLVGVLLGLAVLWLALVVILWSGARDRVRLKEALRLLPDLMRLLTALARDPAVPRRVRWMLGGLMVYLALPIDLVPDFLPAIGYADDAVVTALVLRFTVKAAGAEAISGHWSGTDEGLSAIMRLAGVPRPGG